MRKVIWGVYSYTRFFYSMAYLGLEEEKDQWEEERGFEQDGKWIEKLREGWRTKERRIHNMSDLKSERVNE